MVRSVGIVARPGCWSVAGSLRFASSRCGEVDYLRYDSNAKKPLWQWRWRQFSVSLLGGHGGYVYVLVPYLIRGNVLEQIETEGARGSILCCSESAAGIWAATTVTA